MDTNRQGMADVVSQGKPRLAVRRPAQSTTKDREHMNAAAAAVDARVREAERRKRIARFKKAVGNFISITLMLAFLLVGYAVWKAVRRQELPALLPESVKQMITNAAEKANVEIGK